MSECAYCNQHVNHRQGFPEHGETDGYDYRTSSIKPDSDICEPSPSGSHSPTDSTGSWHHLPMRIGGPMGGTTFATRYEWARFAFYTSDGTTDIPAGLRRAITRLFATYPNMPEGTADPAYMAHVIMRECRMEAVK